MADVATARVAPVRNLHWVFKVADRTATAQFYQALGMQVLRHEEFTEGCAASCNGPYDGKWSKTMIGYGSEDDHFVLELTYNYGVKEYVLGNDFQSITICSRDVFQRAIALGATPQAESAVSLTAPGGYRYVVRDADAPTACPITAICLNVTDLDRSLAYWAGFLGFTVVCQAAGEAQLSCGSGQTLLTLTSLPPGQAIDHGSAFGRIAFSCPGHQLERLERDILAAGYPVHTPYVSLDTPGKASVQVVILADPDGHEICFVGDEGFRDLSCIDTAGAQLLADAIVADDSDAWFAQRAQQEAQWQAKGL